MAWPADAPLVFVVNARSGKQAADDVVATISATMQTAGRRFEVMQVGHPKRIAQVASLAARRAATLAGAVIAVGGDGTLNAVAQAALGEGVVFGAVPQGTFNYFGRAHGLSQQAELAAKALLDAQPQPTQVGLVNGQVFLVNASLGLYPTLLEDREAFKQQYGRSRVVAVFAGLATLFRWRRQLSLQIRDQGQTRTVRTPTLFIGNNALQLQQVGVAEAEAVASPAPRLAAVMVRPISGLEMLGLAFRGALGRLGEAEQVETFAFERLDVDVLGRRRAKVATDGEVRRMLTPLRFEVSANPLLLLTPAPQDRVEIA